MLSIKNWKEFINNYKWETNRVHYDVGWQSLLYIDLICTIFLTPVAFLVDILIFPLEIGYLIFKRIVE